MLIKIFENKFSGRDLMLQISKEELVFVVEKFFERKTYIAVQPAFCQRFNQVPIQQNVTKYCSHGTSLNRNKEKSARRRTGRSEENIELVRNILENNPNLTWICIEKYDRHVE